MSLVGGTSASETTASNPVPDSPVAITVTVSPLSCEPDVLLMPEIVTLVPGMKLLTA